MQISQTRIDFKFQKRKSDFQKEHHLKIARWLSCTLLSQLIIDIMYLKVYI